MRDLTAEERAFLKHVSGASGDQQSKSGNYKHSQWDLLVKDVEVPAFEA